MNFFECALLVAFLWGFFICKKEFDSSVLEMSTVSTINSRNNSCTVIFLLSLRGVFFQEMQHYCFNLRLFLLLMDVFILIIFKELVKHVMNV